MIIYSNSHMRCSAANIITSSNGGAYFKEYSIRSPKENQNSRLFLKYDLYTSSILNGILE